MHEGGREGRQGWSQEGESHSKKSKAPGGGPSCHPSTSALIWSTEGKGKRQGGEELIFPKGGPGGPLDYGDQAWGLWVENVLTDPQLFPRSPGGRWYTVGRSWASGGSSWQCLTIPWHQASILRVS